MGVVDDVAVRWFELCDKDKTGQLYLTFALQAQVREGASARSRASACRWNPLRRRLALTSFPKRAQAWPCHASKRLAMPSRCRCHVAALHSQGGDALATRGLRLLLWADASRIGSRDRHSSDARQAARR